MKPETGRTRLHVALALLSMSSALAAAEEPALPEISVVGGQNGELSAPATERPRSEETVTAEGIRIYSGPAQTNAYRALSGLPSVMFEAADPYGLSSSQSIRSRGRPNSSQAPGQTYEGMPIGNLGGFTGIQMFDLENVGAIDFYRGAVPIDKGVGFVNASGSVDMHFLRPADVFGGQVKASFGSFGFQRLFARVDSGKLATGTQLFVSASRTEADKWRGAGQSPEGREGIQFGLVQPLGGGVRLELFGLQNDQDQHNYRPLTYAQATDLSTYRDFDYNRTLTGNAAQDVAYYGFNRQSVKNQALFGTLRFGGPTSTGFLKAYYLKIDGHTWNGSSNALGAPGVVRWDFESEVYGLLAQAERQLYRDEGHEIRGIAGYWFHVQEPPGPPLHQRAYRIAADGSLSFAGWTTLSKMTNHLYSSPYAGLQGKSGAWSWEGGARYLHYRTPSITYYNGAGLADSSYEDAFKQNPATSPDREASSRRLTNWLPNAGVAYAFSPRAKAYVNYGRNYGVPAFGIATTYNAARAQFVAAGTTLQDLWNQADQELSDNLDIGLHLAGDDWYLSPVLYDARYRNRSVQLFDPLLGVSYAQNAGKAHAYGGEIEGGWSPMQGLTLFGGLSLSRFEMSQDIEAASGVVLATAGKQVADAPRFMAKLGASYRQGGWTLTPTARYIGARYGDALNTQKLPGYVVVDLDIRYALPRFAGLKRTTAALTVMNLFDRRYIGIISSNDVDPRGTATFYPGAPRAVAATLAAEF